MSKDNGRTVLQDMLDSRKAARLGVLDDILHAGKNGTRLYGETSRGFALDLLEQGLVTYDEKRDHFTIVWTSIDAVRAALDLVPCDGEAHFKAH